MGCLAGFIVVKRLFGAEESLRCKRTSWPHAGPSSPPTGGTAARLRASWKSSPGPHSLTRSLLFSSLSQLARGLVVSLPLDLGYGPEGHAPGPLRNKPRITLVAWFLTRAFLFRKASKIELDLSVRQEKIEFLDSSPFRFCLSSKVSGPTSSSEPTLTID